MHARTKNRLVREGELEALLEVVAEIAEGRVTVAMQSPAEIAVLVMADMAGLEQEELRVVLLDTRNRVIRVEHLYKGSLNSSMVRIGELFKAAIRENAASVILAHNHPSGDPEPSPEDVGLTRVAVEAGNLLDIPVLDHVVVGRGRWVSLKSRGLGF